MSRTAPYSPCQLVQNPFSGYADLREQQARTESFIAMSLLARIVLVAVAIPLMAISMMDVIFAMDLFGRGMGAQITGAIAILTGIISLFLAIRPGSTRRVLVMGLATLLIAFRLYRLNYARGAFSWDAGGWIIFLLMMGIPLLILVTAILVRPANCALPAQPVEGNSGST